MDEAGSIFPVGVLIIFTIFLWILLKSSKQMGEPCLVSLFFLAEFVKLCRQHYIALDRDLILIQGIVPAS